MLKRGDGGRRLLAVVSWALGAAVVVLTLVAVGAAVSRVSFLANSERVDGTVVGLDRGMSASGSWRGGSAVTYPVVRFRDAAGRWHEFTASVGTSPPSHAVGDTVGVRYRVDDPGDADLTGFWSTWLVVIVTGAIAAVCLVLLFAMRWFAPLSRRAAEALRRDGRRTQGRDARVVVDYEMTWNGEHPWRIEVDIDDPVTGEPRTVRSEALWDEPSDPPPSPIDVYVDPNRPRRYLVDVAPATVGVDR